MNKAVDKIMSYANSKRTHFVITPNMDFLAKAHDDPRLMKFLNFADLAVTDGMPIVWLEHIMGYKRAERVAGVDLVDRICSRCARNGHSIFILGSKNNIIRKAITILKHKYPALRVAGYYGPPYHKVFSLEDNKLILERLYKAKPIILFVALGLPKGEFWIMENKHLLKVPVAIDIGGSFGMISKIVPRAPIWMQKSGLEWFFRLINEPFRLWKRYISDDLRIFLIAIMDKKFRKVLLKIIFETLSKPKLLLKRFIIGKPRSLHGFINKYYIKD